VGGCGTVTGNGEQWGGSQGTFKFEQNVYRQGGEGFKNGSWRNCSLLKNRVRRWGGERGAQRGRGRTVLGKEPHERTLSLVMSVSRKKGMTKIVCGGSQGVRGPGEKWELLGLTERGGETTPSSQGEGENEKSECVGSPAEENDRGLDPTL